MDNQHQKIVGYRDLTQTEIDLMNAIKAHGAGLALLVDEIKAHIRAQRPIGNGPAEDPEIARLAQAQPERWTSIAVTDFQTGLMALTRAVAQPTNF